MTIEFYPAKTRANLRKHGVSFSHAEQALHDANALTVEDRGAVGERRFVTLGMDALGTLLVVVHTHNADKTRVISTRKASRSELEQYHA